MHKRTFSRVGPRRAKLLFYALLAVSVYLGWRLMDVQLIKGPLYAKEALEQRSDTVEVYARRGSILDRDGSVLVRSLPSESVYAVPHDLGDVDKTIAQLQPIVGKIDKQTADLLRDRHLQVVTEQALEKQVNSYHAQSGTAIVMDPNTGEVLAMANFPHFDPNTYWKFPADDYRDRAVQDAYEPGSTFKLVTAAAALEYGKTPLTERFASVGPLEVGGRRIYNAVDGLTPDPNGDTLETIIADSLNVGAAQVALHIGGKDFYKMEQSAGFGEPTQIGLSGENPGIVPAPDQWSGSSLATMAFGQGVSVTPIAMARFYCAIANGGILLRPRIVRAILDAQGNPIYTYPTEIEHRAFSENTAAKLRQFLRAVVVRGTGNPAAQIPGYTTAGKTGTAQMAENGIYEPGAYVASFIGMVPYEHPRYVIYVKVERPQGAIYGSVVAAPAFDEIAKAAMLHAGLFPAMPTPKPQMPLPRLVRPKLAENH